MGGDEFVIIITKDIPQFENLLRAFEQRVESWNLSSRWRFRTDMSSVRSASGTAYLIFQKLQMKECTRVRSNTTPEVEWTEADSKIREIEWRNPFGFFFLPPGTVKEPKTPSPYYSV